MEANAVNPRKGHKGRTWCPDCGEQVVFFWKDKPRFCAMCGVPFDWTAQKTPAESLREAIDYADKTENLLVKIETDVAKKILAVLETPEGRELAKMLDEEKAITEEPVIPEAVV